MLHLKQIIYRKRSYKRIHTFSHWGGGGRGGQTKKLELRNLEKDKILFIFPRAYSLQQVADPVKIVTPLCKMLV